MAERPGFDINRIPTATKVLLGGALVLLVSLFFAWERPAACGLAEELGVAFPCESINGYDTGLGTFLLILTIALLVWEGLRIAGVRIGTLPDRTVNLISLGLAAGVVLFGLLRLLIALTRGATDPAILGLIIGLLGLAAVGYGGYMRWQETPEAQPGTGPTAPPPPGGFSG